METSGFLRASFKVSELLSSILWYYAGMFSKNLNVVDLSRQHRPLPWPHWFWVAFWHKQMHYITSLQDFFDLGLSPKKHPKSIIEAYKPIWGSPNGRINQVSKNGWGALPNWSIRIPGARSAWGSAKSLRAELTRCGPWRHHPQDRADRAGDPPPDQHRSYENHGGNHDEITELEISHLEISGTGPFFMVFVFFCWRVPCQKSCEESSSLTS